MLEWNGVSFIDTLGIPFGSKSPIAVVFLVSYESRNAAMICSDIASSLTLRDASKVKVDFGILIFCCW